MHWILILYMGSYGTSAYPHFIGDFASQKGCESMLAQLQEEENKDHKDDWKRRPFSGKCFYVEN